MFNLILGGSYTFIWIKEALINLSLTGKSSYDKFDSDLLIKAYLYLYSIRKGY